MKSYLSHRSNRWGYDGWALLMPGATIPMLWTVSTTREEVRLLRLERPDLFGRGGEIVKVKITIEVVDGSPKNSPNGQLMPAGPEPDRRVSQGIRFLDFSGISTILPMAPISGCARVREVVTKSVTGDSK